MLELEPAGPQYIERHRQLMDARTSGRGANPSFRNPWTRMEAHWAMVSGGDVGLPLSEGEMDRYRDLAVLAATTAGQDLINETIDRSDTLRGMRTAMRSVTAPSLQIRKTSDEKTVLRANAAPALQSQAMIAAAIAEPGCPIDEDDRQLQRERRAMGLPDDRSTVGRPNSQRSRLLETPPQRPSFNVGMSSGASTAAMTGDTGLPTGDLSFSVAWSAYMQARNIGVDALRVSGNVLQWTPTAEQAVSRGVWTVSARENLMPRWTMLMDARSINGGLGLDNVRPGVAWQMSKANPSWYLQTHYAYGLTTPTRAQTVQQVTVRMLWTSRWSTPSAPYEWPLGQRPGAGGPIWPDDAEPRQNVAVEFLETPAERYADRTPPPSTIVHLTAESAATEQ